MLTLDESDWRMLEETAKSVKYPVERIGLLRQRLSRELPRPGSPWTLLVGRPDAGIELVVARHFNADVADALKAAVDRPLVIGPEPSQIRPTFGSWPVSQSGLPAVGHVVALRSTRTPSPEIMAQLSSLGYFDQLVLVTRLAGPLHEQERQIATSLASLAATARVLIVGLHGEEPTDNDLAEVVAYAHVQMRQAGFREDRRQGADVWFASGPSREKTLAKLDGVFLVSQAAVSSGRGGMNTSAMTKVLMDLKSQVEASPPSPLANIADDEKSRLAKEFQTYLADLERETRKVIASMSTNTAQSVRSFVQDSIQGWGAYSGPEGFWLKYLERLRPGTQAALMAEVHSSLSLLEIDSATGVPTSATSATPNPPWLEQLFVEAKRLAVALVAGILANQAIHAFVLDNPDPTKSPIGLDSSSLFVRWLGYAGFALAAILGYGLSRSLIRMPAHEIREATTFETRSAALRGWEPFVGRLLAWLTTRLNTEPKSALEALQRLIDRLANSENRS